MTPPADSKPQLRRYYASVNTHLYEIAKQTNQLKEQIVFWINQKGYFNPADCLSKFDIDKDQPTK